MLRIAIFLRTYFLYFSVSYSEKIFHNYGNWPALFICLVIPVATEETMSGKSVGWISTGILETGVDISLNYPEYGVRRYGTRGQVPHRFYLGILYPGDEAPTASQLACKTVIISLLHGNTGNIIK